MFSPQALDKTLPPVVKDHNIHFHSCENFRSLVSYVFVKWIERLQNRIQMMGYCVDNRKADLQQADLPA
jgi:hypothetical protein